MRRDVSELVRTGHLSGCPCACSDRPELVWSFRKAGQTQQQIAKMLNVSQGTVSNDLAKDVINIDNVPATRTDTLGREQPRRLPEARPRREQRRAVAGADGVLRVPVAVSLVGLRVGPFDVGL